MISNSTKAKRRQHSAYYEAVAKITVELVDALYGRRFYIVSNPISPSRSIHMEAYGTRQMLQNYRVVLSQIRGRTTMEQASA